jgi:hypothetical protein
MNKVNFFASNDNKTITDSNEKLNEDSTSDEDFIY